jgi:hypothetical protein
MRSDEYRRTLRNAITVVTFVRLGLDELQRNLDLGIASERAEDGLYGQLQATVDRLRDHIHQLSKLANADEPILDLAD